MTATTYPAVEVWLPDQPHPVTVPGTVEDLSIETTQTWRTVRHLVASGLPRMALFEFHPDYEDAGICHVVDPDGDYLDVSLIETQISCGLTGVSRTTQDQGTTR